MKRKRRFTLYSKKLFKGQTVMALNQVDTDIRIVDHFIQGDGKQVVTIELECDRLEYKLLQHMLKAYILDSETVY